LPGEPFPDLLRRLALDASRAVLDWGTTLGQGQHHIPTAAETNILNAIDGQRASTALLLGPKGGGKSALCAAVAAECVRRGFAVLGIRADRLPAGVDTGDDLRRAVGPPLPLAQEVRTLASAGPLLLVIDQLDSVSELIDRRSNRLNLLLDLIRAVSGTPGVHVLAACREFDFRHDARLATLGVDEVRLPLPEWDAVAPVVRAEGHDPDRMAGPLRELLRTPWNLSLFLQVARPGDAFASMQALIESPWTKSVTDAAGSAGRVALLE
jgi:hypothetical protein